MNQTAKRPPCEILKETVGKLKFANFEFDNSLSLEPESQKILVDFAREFHYYKWLGDRKSTRGKHRAFQRKYHRSPAQFPAPINPALVSAADFSIAAPGESIDRNAFLGYFKELKDPSAGQRLTDFFGRPIESLPSVVEPVRAELRQIAGGLPEGDPKQEALAIALKDIGLLLDLCRFVPKLFYYAAENRLPQLKTGHLIALVSGMQRYFAALARSLLESGLAGATLDRDRPVFATVERTNQVLTRAVRAMTLDLVIPLALASNLRLEWKKDSLVIEPAIVIEKSFFTRLFDLFKRKETAAPAAPAEEPEPAKQASAAGKKPAPKPEKPADVQVVDSRYFVEMRAGVEKFACDLKTDLAPEKNERGEVADYKSMFDQFDVPASARDLTFTRFLLRGRLTGVDPTDYRYQDQTIVSSVHWLYDRLTYIASHWQFDASPVSRFDAESFIEAMRGLYFIGQNETDETKRYGNFPQFRISMKRLFASDAKQVKYNGMINSISGLMDKARDEMEKAWKRSK